MGKLQLLGASGEQYVVDYLLKNNFQIIDRNWRIKGGEIDIIARENGQTVFVEVKTRTSLGFGHPLEAIDREKAYRLQRLALAWVCLHDMWGSEYRIDGAAVLLAPGTPAQVEYRRGIL
jgi:putative endonuclease